MLESQGKKFRKKHEMNLDIKKLLTGIPLYLVLLVGECPNANNSATHCRVEKYTD